MVKHNRKEEFKPYIPTTTVKQCILTEYIEKPLHTDSYSQTILGRRDRNLGTKGPSRRNC